MAVLDPDELFEQSELLIAARKPGPPRQVDIRRAISSAYYGVFHFVCAQAANLHVGQKWQREARYALVYRSVDHRDLRAACNAVLAVKLDQTVAQLAPADGFRADIKRFAVGAAELQSRRHTADYDPLVLLPASNARYAISAGRIAVAAFSQASPDERAAFLTLLLFKRR